MIRTARRVSPRVYAGFTLIELLISITIGLLVSVATFSAYIGASAASRTANAQGRMNEDAQAALLILSQQLRMSGNNPDRADRVDDPDPSRSSRRNPVYGATTFPTGTFTTSNFSVRGCDGQFSNINSATNLDTLDCSSGASILPDSIAVNYEADSFNTIPTTTSTGGLPTDCLGKKLNTIVANLPAVVGAGSAVTTATYSVADNRFYIGTSTSVVSPSLYCKGNGDSSTARALVENVEDMQLTYGTASSTSSSTVATVAGYLQASDLAALSPPSNNPVLWGKVLTVRICVLVRSGDQVVSDASSARYFNCNGTLEPSPPDRRLRQAYFATVVLRNRRL